MRAIISLADYNSSVPEWSFYFGGSLISLGEFGLTFLDWHAWSGLLDKFWILKRGSGHPAAWVLRRASLLSRTGGVLQALALHHNPTSTRRGA
jgi:hypothetical protein